MKIIGIFFYDCLHAQEVWRGSGLWQVVNNCAQLKPSLNYFFQVLEQIGFKGCWKFCYGLVATLEIDKIWNDKESPHRVVVHACSVGILL